jgi:hypothetical protein
MPQDPNNIPPDVFLYYADYFAYAVEAGLNRARALFPSIEVSTRVDVNTIVDRPNSDLAIANATRSFDTTYENIWTDATALAPIQKAFEGLADYVLVATGLDINSYLEAHGIKVFPLYASLSSVFGEEIEGTNVRS